MSNFAFQATLDKLRYYYKWLAKRSHIYVAEFGGVGGSRTRVRKQKQDNL